MTAVFAIVDDPDGKLGVRIGLYNFVRYITHRRPKDIYHYLPVGTILAIMNPWFKKTADGGLTIRCDNPAEVVSVCARCDLLKLTSSRGNMMCSEFLGYINADNG